MLASTGLSGFDVNGTVKQLVALERDPTLAKINRKEAIYQSQISALGNMKSSLSELEDAMERLSRPSSWNVISAKSSNTNALTVSAGSFGTATGNHQVEIQSLASNQTLASATSPSRDTSVGAGTLTISMGSWNADGTFNSSASDPVTITIDQNNDSLEGIRDAINKSEAGVKASIVNDGSGYRLVMNGDKTGSQNAFKIDVADGDGNSADALGLSQFAYTDPATTVMQTTKAAGSAQLVVDGIAVTSQSNTVAGAIPGVTLDLKNADVGTKIRVDLTADTSSIKKELENLVTKYNDFMNMTNSLTKASKDEDQRGAFTGDASIRSLQNQVRAKMTDQSTIEDSSIRSLADLGVKTNRKTGLLEFSASDYDSGRLDKALKNNLDDVKNFFIPSGANTNSGVDFLSFNSKTKPGSYDVEITQPATRGKMVGDSTATMPDFANGGKFTIDDGNDEMVLRIDGHQTPTVKLTQGDYASGAELAAEMEKQINAGLSEKSPSVSVSWNNTDGRLEISSNSYGSGSTVAINSIEQTGSSQSFGLAVGGGTSGQSVKGTINGEAATGVGRTLTSTAGDSEGLRLTINAGSAGSYGSITYSQGLGKQADTLLDSFLKVGVKDDGSDSGMLNSRKIGLNKSIDGLDTDREDLGRRIAQYQARLFKQFNAMDAMVSQLNNISNFLTQTLDNLPGYVRKDR